MVKTRVFKSGNSLAVRLPKEFAVDSEELFITRVGTSLLLRATSDRGGLLREALGQFSDDFMEAGRMQPPLPEIPLFDLAADEAVRYEVDAGSATPNKYPKKHSKK
jgi:antitoxin VapB